MAKRSKRKQSQTRAAIRAAAIRALETKGRRVTPDIVVAAAEALDHPLHPDFDWDNDSAGHKYRLDQARAYIAEVRVVITTSTKKLVCPGYVRDPDAMPREQGYIATQALQSEEAAALAALQSEMVQVQARLERCREIAAGLELEADFDLLLAAAVDVRTRIRDGRGRPSEMRVDA